MEAEGFSSLVVYELVIANDLLWLQCLILLLQ